MVSAPGETPGEWWVGNGCDGRNGVAVAENRGYSVEFDLEMYFLHDLGAEDTAFVLGNPGYEADIAFLPTLRFRQGGPTYPPLRS